MVGCMLGTSMAMRAALPVAAQATFVDLDGAYLLSDDRPEPLHYQDGQIDIDKNRVK